MSRYSKTLVEHFLEPQNRSTLSSQAGRRQRCSLTLRGMTPLCEDLRPNGNLVFPREYLNDSAAVVREASASEVV